MARPPEPLRSGASLVPSGTGTAQASTVTGRTRPFLGIGIASLMGRSPKQMSFVLRPGSRAETAPPARPLRQRLCDRLVFSRLWVTLISLAQGLRKIDGLLIYWPQLRLRS